ncbi:MAG TPA: DUF1592 domain-containing protein [Methylomirabilota bacterium]|nr:DUF1592 domain-containing protein [Methylomirabilota bacterium]
MHPDANTQIKAAALALCLSGGLLFAAPDEEYGKDIRPLLERKCYECHGPELQKGDLNLSAFSDFETIQGAPEVWQMVLERVQAYEMPPKKAGELNYNQFQTLVKWLRNLPKPDEVDCDQIASDRTANFYRGYVMSRRLNRAEYLNTLRDLFGVTPPIEDVLPADGGGGEGFDTTGNALFLSSIHIERYLLAAQIAVETVLPDTPRGLSKELKAARQHLLVTKPSHTTTARDAAADVLHHFARRAFRRPVSDKEIERMMTLFDRAHDRGDGYLPALRLALQSVLISPHFLFLAEPEPDQGGVHPLGAVPLASKLSYFLWSSMPDERLLKLAENGDLLDPDIYRAEIRRMLADHKAGALGERFALQWLEVERLGHEVRPDPDAWPEFDDALNESLHAEVITFFNHIFRNDRPILELIDADYTFVNQRLAQLYGLEGISGDRFQRVSFNDPQRGGILGMAAIHTLTSYPLRTSPVLRGRWVLEALLGDKVPPPPPEVPALDEEGEALAHLSLREQLEQHRVQAECAACHDKMDPLGFGLENYDVLGRWRDTDKGLPIDARGTLPSGESFEGPDGLKQVLLDRKDRVLRHLARKMTGYAFGRELNKFDNCVIDQAMEALEMNDYRSSALIEAIATSFQFRHRFYPKHESNDS